MIETLSTALNTMMIMMIHDASVQSNKPAQQFSKVAACTFSASGESESGVDMSGTVDRPKVFDLVK